MTVARNSEVLEVIGGGDGRKDLSFFSVSVDHGEHHLASFVHVVHLVDERKVVRVHNCVAIRRRFVRNRILS